jgi:23S rRNA pseudouridine2457 synthase
MPFRYFLLNKPYHVLSQFTGEKTDSLLGDLYDFPKDVYPVGRLDKDSEGLLLLTNDNRFKTTLLDPKNKHVKTYTVQVEGEITDDAIRHLSAGSITFKHNGKAHRAAPATCKRISPPNYSERIPPIRFRAEIPTSWIALSITEGKNRQVRKMTAAVGFPTLRLIRSAIGKLEINTIPPGSVLEIDAATAQLAFK